MRAADLALANPLMTLVIESVYYAYRKIQFHL
jgi:hypothetical protein